MAVCVQACPLIYITASARAWGRTVSPHFVFRPRDPDHSHRHESPSGGLSSVLLLPWAGFSYEHQTPNPYTVGNLQGRGKGTGVTSPCPQGRKSKESQTPTAHTVLQVTGPFSCDWATSFMSVSLNVVPLKSEKCLFCQS